MKKLLKILLVIGAIVTLPLSLKAQNHSGHSDNSGYFVEEDLGEGIRQRRPVTQDDIDKANARRDKREAEKRAKEDAKAQGYDGYFYQKNTSNRNETYTGGTVNLSSDFVKNQKQNMMSDGMQSMGAISQGASTLTKDPKTAGIVSAFGAGIGGTSTFINAAQYGNLAGKYATMQSLNEQKEIENTQKMAALKAQLKAEKPGTDAYRQIETDIQEIRIQRNAQREARKQARSDKWGNYTAMGASVLGGSAMIFMGERQYDMYRQMDNDQKACKKDPTKCIGYIPPKPERDNRPLPTPADTRPTGPEGFDPNRLPKPAQAALASKDGAPSANRATSGNRSGHTPDLLSSNGLSGKASPLGSTSDSDFGGEYSGDQSFGSASGGSGSGRESAGSYVSSGGSSLSSNEDMNFDISQFVPSWMKNQQDENGFLVTSTQAPQTKKETKGLLLGKNSPSLFTRVSQAYQKKAHELKEEVL